MEETMEMHKGMTTHWWEQITSQRASVLVQDRHDLSSPFPTQNAVMLTLLRTISVVITLRDRLFLASALAEAWGCLCPTSTCQELLNRGKAVFMN